MARYLWHYSVYTYAGTLQVAHAFFATVCFSHMPFYCDVKGWRKLVHKCYLWKIFPPKITAVIQLSICVSDELKSFWGGLMYFINPHNSFCFKTVGSIKSIQSFPYLIPFIQLQRMETSTIQFLLQSWSLLRLANSRGGTCLVHTLRGGREGRVFVDICSYGMGQSRPSCACNITP